MPEKPPLYEQETKYSCAPACLRMVLAALGLLKTEEEIREDCDCTILGTFADDLVRVAKKYGFANTRKDYLSLTDLKKQLDLGLYPIVYIGVRAYSHSRPEEHAAVVIKINENKINLLDPSRGEIVLSEEEFENQWSYMRLLTIIVE
jgi:ABC-type bacteriocin/lantibiotic exporter with double-glycine peptidase domain